MIQVELVSGQQGLAALRTEWDGLFDSLPRRTHAQSHAWAVQQIRCLEPDAAGVRVAVAREAGVTIAIAPLVACHRTHGLFELARWSLLWHPHSTLSPLLLAPPAPAGGVMREIVRALRQEAGGCDQLLLPSMIDDGSCAGLSELLAQPLVTAQVAHPSMGFDTHAPDSALAASSPHFRQNLARQRRRLHGMGAVEFFVAKGAAAARTAYAEFLDVEASGWKGEGGTSSAISLHPNLRQFYAGLIDSLQGRQEVWIALLRLDGRAVAANFCVRTDGTLALLKIGYDESLRQAAPGNVLLAMLLDACEHDPAISHVSLVTGPAWAERWRPRVIAVRRMAVCAPTLRGRLIHVAANLKHAAGRARGSGRLRADRSRA